MQIFIVRQKPEDSERSACRILKVVSFEKNRVDSAAVLKCARGQAHNIDCGKNFRTGSIAFQFVLGKLEGYQIRWARSDQDPPPARPSSGAFPRPVFQNELSALSVATQRSGPPGLLTECMPIQRLHRNVLHDRAASRAEAAARGGRARAGLHVHP
eukprot:9243506-Pyramimonas_sp.AAC.1